MRGIDEYRYFVMLNSALSAFGLAETFDVKLYPNDFSNNVETLGTTNRNLPSDSRLSPLSYRCNTKTGVRHNNNCADYYCKNCVPCGPNEGKKACGKCGG